MSGSIEGSGLPSPKSRAMRGSTRVSFGLVRSMASKYWPLKPVPVPTCGAMHAGIVGVG